MVLVANLLKQSEMAQYIMNKDVYHRLIYNAGTL